MINRIALSVCLSTLLSVCVTDLTIAQTPFSFVRRGDVGREINVSPSQLNRVDQLQPLCDARCRQRMRQTMSSMVDDIRSTYQSLSSDEQRAADNWLEQDVRESVELEVLDDLVLNDPQMSRFRELWTQFFGMDSLTSGESSRRLGMSPIQINQIQQIQGIGSTAIQECIQNPQLTEGQQNILIQNIQNIVIDQSVNILNENQIVQFLGMCGEPCEFDPSADPDGDDIADSGGNESGSTDDGISLNETPTTGSDLRIVSDLGTVSDSPTQIPSSARSAKANPRSRSLSGRSSARSGSTRTGSTRWGSSSRQGNTGKAAQQSRNTGRQSSPSRVRRSSSNRSGSSKK